jgi:hypothetical protein
MPSIAAAAEAAQAAQALGRAAQRDSSSNIIYGLACAAMPLSLPEVSTQPP